ncbi:MAG TPA: hypothetical protein DCL15_06060 [Chloroflexi bacterium]|nr:hypothetical protein [Chloroflexota bacterium]HHW86277.1 hypothetical protein [Chloroflexota bacterium]
MKYVSGLVLIAFVFGLVVIDWGAPALADETPKVLEFKTMAGVSRPYTGGANAIRGVSGGGLPWVLNSAKGELRADGKLEVKVKGLVFDPNDPVVIERGLAGQNTVPEFRAVVSCQSVDGNGNATVINLATAPFPATTGLGAGDAEIKAYVPLPSPCIAPIIFVTNPAGAWFAATGQ